MKFEWESFTPGETGLETALIERESLVYVLESDWGRALVYTVRGCQKWSVDVKAKEIIVDKFEVLEDAKKAAEKTLIKHGIDVCRAKIEMLQGEVTGIELELLAYRKELTKLKEALK